MFLSNLFLARLLSPNDFGSIGMIMFFVAIASIIVDGGFASALIQKKTINNEDYSTAFHVNMILSIILYVILYFSAPLVADFYSNPPLSGLLRVLGLLLIVNALGVVQIAKIKRELNFKYLGIVSIVSSFVGCCVGVACAFCSMGVWSLVVQSLTISAIKSGILFTYSSCKSYNVFSIKSLKVQFNFGSMMLLSNLVDTIYSNLISLVVGKFFSPKILGVYTQARTLESVPNNTLVTVVQQVMYPVFSRLQDDAEKLKEGVRKSVKVLVWINFPLMILLIVVADPLIRLLYTDKWIDAIPLFQIACIGGMMNCIVQVNMQILAACGRGWFFFASRLYRQGVGVLLIIFGLYCYGLYGVMCLGVGFSPYLFWIINVIYTKKVMSYGFKEQFLDIFPTYCLSILCGVLVYFLSFIC
ncbi:MAG: lipopolysaccharide biosynthesis protein, partial [Bacteroidales bacterium]|nr:lipopolysaccharide biosynthesis protein [Bacteroidales bacterium]